MNAEVDRVPTLHLKNLAIPSINESRVQLQKHNAAFDGANWKYFFLLPMCSNLAFSIFLSFNAPENSLSALHLVNLMISIKSTGLKK